MRLISCLIFTILSTICLAQEFNMLNPMNSDLHIKTSNYLDLIDHLKIQPIWDKNGEDFYYYDNLQNEFILVDSSLGRKKVFINSTSIRTIEKTLSDTTDLEVKFEEIYQNLIHSKDKIGFKFNGFDYFFSPSTYELLEKKESIAEASPRKIRKSAYSGASDIYEVLSPNKKYFLGLNENNGLQLRVALSEVILSLNSDFSFNPKFTWDITEAQYSQDSNRFIVTAADMQKVNRYPLITDWQSKRPVVDLQIPYVTAEDPLAPEYIFIANIQSGSLERIEIPNERDEYRISLNGWVDQNNFIFSTIDRLYAQRHYYIYNMNTGIRRLFSETSPTYLIDHPLNYRAKSLKFFNGSAFLISEQDGKADIFSIDLTSGTRQKLLVTDLIVEEIIDYVDGAVYFTALNSNRERPYEIQLFRLSNNVLTQITTMAGTHDFNGFLKGIYGEGRTEKVILSPNKKYVLDYFSSLEKPLEVNLLSSSGEFIVNLGNSEIPKLVALGWTPPERFKFKSADGSVDLFGVIFKPFDFDANKKYPVVNFIYGGPQVVWTPQYFTTSEHVFATSLAQLGFIVIMQDARGTPDRGKAFQDYNYKRFGQVEVFDHVHVLKKLCEKYSYMDLDRIGVIGSSYGGFQTLKFMTLAPKFFKVGVSNAAVAELRDVHQGSLQMYMGDVTLNKDGYDSSAVVSNIDQLEGKLLIMHGAQDVNAPLFGMMKLLHAMIEKDIDYDFFLLPQNAHSRNAYTWQKIKRYFLEHL